MLLFDGTLGLIAIAVWIFCVIDVITTAEDQMRHLPKLAWVVIVILLLDVGAIVWLVAGRVWNSPGSSASDRDSFGGSAARHPSGRPPARPTNPDDDEEFLASLQRRAEEQRRRARDASRDPGDEPTVDPSAGTP